MAGVVTSLEERVSAVLNQRFHVHAMDVHRNSEAERISGRIVTSDFDGMQQIDRQRVVHNALRDALGADSDGVSIILTFTPDEYEALRED